MKLHTIPAEMERLIDTETGEVSEFEQFMALQLEYEERVQYLLKAYKNELAYADAVKAEAKAMHERAQKATKRAENLKQYLQFALGGKPYQCEVGEVKYRKSTAVIVDDNFIDWAEMNNHKEYLRYKDPEPDKTAIKEALKAGADIPAKLEERQSINII